MRQKLVLLILLALVVCFGIYAATPASASDKTPETAYMAAIEGYEAAVINRANVVTKWRTLEIEIAKIEHRLDEAVATYATAHDISLPGTEKYRDDVVELIITLSALRKKLSVAQIAEVGAVNRLTRAEDAVRKTRSHWVKWKNSFPLAAK